MAQGNKSFCPSTAPRVEPEASVEIWKGNFQFGLLKIGASGILVFKASNVDWQSGFHLNSQSFLGNLKNGDATFVKFSINLL